MNKFRFLKTKKLYKYRRNLFFLQKASYSCSFICRWGWNVSRNKYKVFCIFNMQFNSSVQEGKRRKSLKLYCIWNSIKTVWLDCMCLKYSAQNGDGSLYRNTCTFVQCTMYNFLNVPFKQCGSGPGPFCPGRIGIIFPDLVPNLNLRPDLNT